MKTHGTPKPSGVRDVRLDGLKVYLAGHTGLVGQAMAKLFSSIRNVRLLTTARTQTDLTDSAAVARWLAQQRPDIVVVAAGRVGGILANASYPANFIYENLMIETNLIHNAWRSGVKRLLNFGSTCMYPKHCSQPLHPELLMTGPMEPTSEPYAIAKLAGLTLCEAYNRQYGTGFLTAIPCTLYGPGDSFDPLRAHVVSSLIAKLHEAKRGGEREVTLWGSGKARREFLYVDDLAEACEVLLRRYDGSDPVNIGSGKSLTIRETAETIAEIVGFSGDIHWDATQPDGAPEKLLDSEVIQGMGWAPRTDLREGLEETYRWFLKRASSHSTGKRLSQPVGGNRQ